jgi:hypothetical protein
VPHSRTGRKVEIGDQVVTVETFGNGSHYATGGTVVSISEGETCNAQLVPFGAQTQYVTLKNCVHVGDLVDFSPRPPTPGEQSPGGSQ